MIVTANLPPEVKDFHFVKNHHYVALKDADGNEIQLDAETILLGDCVDEACRARVVAFTNAGLMTCPHCQGPVKWRYTRPQLAFIAEHESKFMGWDAKKNNE